MKNRRYHQVGQVLEHLAQAVERGTPPDRDAVADLMGLSPAHAARSVQEHAGLTPSAVVGALRGARALGCRAESGATTLDWAWAAGLSGSGRLHDLVVTETGMTPREVTEGGAGIPMTVGIHPSPFGPTLLAVTPRGLAHLAFWIPTDGDPTPERALALIARRWPEAVLRYDAGATAPWAHQALPGSLARPTGPLALHVRGTAFQRAVWRALLALPAGTTTTYGAIARDIGAPRASRAVGGAVGANPLAILIPCHRVLGAGGSLGGYRWGPDIKRALLSAEGAPGFTSGRAARRTP